jgi:hypothetical protein
MRLYRSNREGKAAAGSAECATYHSPGQRPGFDAARREPLAPKARPVTMVSAAHIESEAL